MSIPRILLGAALVATLSMPLVGQQKTTGYYQVACVKVNSGQDAAFSEWVEGASHKLDQESVDSGRISNSLVLRTVSPRGTEAKCDYVFVDFFSGLPPAPGSGDFSKALHNAGISMTPKEFYAKRDELGTLVSINYSQTRMLVGEAKKGDYIVLNQMGAPDIGACLALEEKVWQPLAEEMVKAGDADGWATQVQISPRGDKDNAGVSSVDIYPSWDAAFKQRDSIGNGWKKVHPDMDINNTMEQFGKLCPIEHTVLYHVVDSATPKK